MEMKSPSPALTRIVAVLFIASTAYLYYDGRKLATALDDAEARHTDVTDMRAKAEGKLYWEKKTSKKLRQKMDAVSGQLASTRLWLEDMKAAADSSELAIDVLEEILAENDEDGPAGFFSMLMENMASNGMSDAMVDMTHQLRYGDLDAALGLTEEKAEAVHEILKEQQKREFGMARDAMLGKADSEQYDADENDAYVRLALSEVLDPDELEAFDAFEEGASDRMIRKAYEVALLMSARGLSPENQELTLDVLVEEILFATDEEQDPADAFNPEVMTQQFDVQMAAFEASLDRLSGQMDDDQFALVERFVEQQIAVQENTQRMMQAMFGSNNQN